VLDGAASIVREDGVEVTAGFLRGARAALEVCARHGIRRAFLRSARLRAAAPRPTSTGGSSPNPA
jgi:uncharacterized protein YbbK (DUF523 family)